MATNPKSPWAAPLRDVLGGRRKFHHCGIRRILSFAINSLDAGVIAFGNRKLFVSTREADHIAFFIIVSGRALHAGESAIYSG